jgi:hypothetical protein
MLSHNSFKLQYTLSIFLTKYQAKSCEVTLSHFSPYKEDRTDILYSMGIYHKHGALIVESEWIVRLSGLLMAGKKGANDAKATAFIPFVFVRKKEYATPLFINHERIHFKQQIETLIIGSWILHILEDLYSKFFLKLTYPNG